MSTLCVPDHVATSVRATNAIIRRQHISSISLTMLRRTKLATVSATSFTGNHNLYPLSHMLNSNELLIRYHECGLQENKAEYKSNLPFGINSLLRTDQRSEGKQSDVSCSKRRKRCSFSAEQVYRLEVEFQRQRYLSPDTRSRLALMLGLTQQQVKIWFQNRRYKSKPKEETKATNVERSENMVNEMENRENLTRPVTVLIRDGCPTFEYFMTVFKQTTRKLNCI